MTKDLHESRFDDATQVKLAVFGGYIREWLPVFLTARKSGHNVQAINVFDFFAGPGTDSAGNPGSPRIIQNELKDYCETHGDMKVSGIRVKLYFNDDDTSKIEQLRRSLEENACDKECCEPILSSLPFREAIIPHLAIMQEPGNANLVIMDQYGIKEVTPDVVNRLAQCGTTDILFFISSSYIRRFASEPAIQSYFQLSAEELGSSEYRSIHRHVCEYFRSRLRQGVEYHLAPFSIKKGSNIYGVMFGSGSLLGLEKFLRVCWKLDGVTGEANFDIDEDPIRYGQLSLFEEDNTAKKERAFQRELEEMLSSGSEPPTVDNLDVYRFTLERGFLPKHASEHLKHLQAAGRLQVTSPESGALARRGAFYLNWEQYRDRKRAAVFRLKN